jgi:hypothetical protein
MEAERASLHTATAYAADPGQPEHAVAIPMLGFLRVHGRWKGHDDGRGAHESRRH